MHNRRIGQRPKRRHSRRTTQSVQKQHSGRGEAPEQPRALSHQLSTASSKRSARLNEVTALQLQGALELVHPLLEPRGSNHHLIESQLALVPRAGRREPLRRQRPLQLGDEMIVGCGGQQRLCPTRSALLGELSEVSGLALHEVGARLRQGAAQQHRLIPERLHFA